MISDSERFTEACGYIIPFGKHKGDTIARVGASAEGLRYLDWMAGLTITFVEFKAALKLYLDHPAISRQLDAILEDQ